MSAKHIDYEKVDITKDDFDAYENVRESGIYNMFDPRAKIMTGLPEHKYYAIIKYYNKFSKQFL